MDFAKSTGLMLLPSRGRVTTNLPRFFAAAKATGMTIPGAVVIDADEYAANAEAYDLLDLPSGWTVHVTQSTCTAEATNQAYRDLCDGLDWVAWGGDDLVPETQNWDRIMVEALLGWNLVCANDGYLSPAKSNGINFWSGDLLRAVGYFYPESLCHFYLDDVWEELGRVMNCRHVLMDVVTRHAHAAQTGRKDATFAKTNSCWETDEAAYIKWCNTDRVPAANRIGEMLLAYNIGVTKPDLSGTTLMIATPCGSGRYERLYVRSLLATLQMTKDLGATVNWFEMPYCSDVSLARNKLFGAFLRSGFTHLLMIDDDMGWNPQDIVRMLQLKRDFVAVAGPRKTFPPSYAVNVSDDFGNATPIHLRPDSTVIEVSEVGMAFTLLSRECAERMRAAYEDELSFRAPDGRTEYAVFNPIVTNHRYMSEDFAFCWRWRKIKGLVHVISDITLNHVGVNTWTGCWLEHLNAILETQMREAA